MKKRNIKFLRNLFIYYYLHTMDEFKSKIKKYKKKTIK